jgi:hypothetical protein
MKWARHGPALMLASGILATSAAAQAPTVLSPPVELMRAACVTTDMQRESLEATANDRGWSSRLPPDGALPHEWGERYVTESAQILLLGADTTERRGHHNGSRTTYPAFRNCTVAFVDPVGDWRGDMATLAEELDLSEADVLTPTVGRLGQDGEFRQWSKRGELMWWTYSPSERVLRMEIYRSLDRRMTFPSR